MSGLFRVVKYRHEFDNKPQEHEISWEHFVSAMKHDVRPKKSGPAFSPIKVANSLEGFKVDGYEYDPKDKTKKTGQVWIDNSGRQLVTDMENVILRRNVNIESLSMAVLDYDKGLVSPQAIREQLADLNYVIYSSHSHLEDPQLPKFRVVLPFKEPLTAEQFKASWPFAFEHIDKSCKDLARIFFLPSCPPERKDLAFVWSQSDKKFFSPKPAKAKGAPAPKKEKPKKKKLMDFRSLDAVAWFTVHGAYIRAHSETKHWVACPWAHAHTEGKSGEKDAVLWVEAGKWPTFNCSHAHCEGKGIKEVMALWGDADKHCSKELSYKDLESKTVVRCLGFDEDGRYYYQCNNTAHIVALRSAEHKELNFYGITADLDYWFKNFGDEESGRVAWKAAAASMMNTCHKKGFFRPDKVRGGGIWSDTNRVVAHLGKNLLVDGKRIPLSDFKSDSVYEAAVHDVDLPAPLPVSEAKRVLELACRLPVGAPSAFYLAGIIPAGMMSGILDWRPHLWLTGDQASGKSSILSDFINPLWNPVTGLSISEGKTTDAGIRQKLKRNAFPVILDESEADSRLDAERIESIITLARSSSSVTDGRVLKGTVSGHGMEFSVRSCFVLCSIACALDKPQDKQRFTVVDVVLEQKHVDGWPELKADLKATFTREFALGLYSRVISMAEVILQNVKMMQQAVMESVKGADRRYGEQLGTLLAGAFSLISDDVATIEQCRTVIQSLGHLFEREADRSEANVAMNALQSLLSHIVREDGKSQSIYDLVQRARSYNNYTDSTAAKMTLMHYGVRVDDGMLCISSNHTQTKQIFREYGVSGHYGLLSLLPGTKKVVKRFGALVGMSICIPTKEIFDNPTVAILPKDEEEPALPF